jgi:hypothetical protein
MLRPRDTSTRERNYTDCLVGTGADGSHGADT